MHKKKSCFRNQCIESSRVSCCLSVPREQCGVRGARKKEKRTPRLRNRNMKNLSIPQQWPIRAVKKQRGPTWGRILLEERAVSLLFLIPVSLWLSNQSLTEAMPVPLVYILMNQGNYSCRFWSVSLWCSLSTVTVYSAFVIFPPKELFGVQTLRVSWGQSLSTNLDLPQDAMLKGIHTWNGWSCNRQCRQNEAQHQIKPLPSRFSSYLYWVPWLSKCSDVVNKL